MIRRDLELVFVDGVAIVDVSEYDICSALTGEVMFYRGTIKWIEVDKIKDFGLNSIYVSNN